MGVGDTVAAVAVAVVAVFHLMTRRLRRWSFWSS
jgi:hypothetical protein